MFANVPTNLIAFIIVLGFLVFAHEAGHFLIAKLFRVRVIVFSFGFGKRLFGVRKGDTDYRVSLIPLGGYVRMAGDAADEETVGAPDEYLSKPKWQRFLILVAGPFINLVIAVIFLAFFFALGTEVLKESNPVIGSVVEDGPAVRAGLRPGDRVVEANGEPVETWEDLKLAVGLNAETAIELVVLREGDPQRIALVPERVMTDYGPTGMIGVSPWFSSEIGRVVEGSAADAAGLRLGDRILSAGGTPIEQMNDLEQKLAASEKEPLELVVSRDGSTFTTMLPPSEESGEPYPGFGLPTMVRQYAPADALRESLNQNWRMTKYIFITLGRLVRLEGSVEDFSGPISIARISGEMLRSGLAAMIYLMAVISLNLGILNLLPIPVLDGGHIAILGVEGVMRRDLSPGAKERIYKIGFALIAALMIVVIYHDVIQNVAILRRG